MPAVTCPNCSGRTQVEDQYMGWQVRCPHCSAEFTAGRAAAPPAPPNASGGFSGYPPPPGPGDVYDQGEWGRQAAAARLSGPATGLKVVGWFGVILGPLGVVMWIFLLAVAFAAPQQGQAEELVAQAIIYIPQSIIATILGVLILIGTGKMLRFESSGWGTAVAIAAMIPCASPCCLIGLPCGIMVIQALNDPTVRAAFDRAAAGDPRRYGGY